MAKLINMKAARQHTIYRNASGKRLPGVTTIVGTLAKPNLPRWAVSVERQGYVYEDYLKHLGLIGSCAHEMCAAYLEDREPDVAEYSDEVKDIAMNSAIHFVEWAQNHEIQLIASEQEMVSESLQVGGTMDIHWTLDGVYEVADIKTSDSGIYLENAIQVAAYARLARENGFRVDRLRIIRVGKDESAPATSVVIDMEQAAVLEQMFVRLRDNYEDARVMRKAIGIR